MYPRTLGAYRAAEVSAGDAHPAADVTDSRWHFVALVLDAEGQFKEVVVDGRHDIAAHWSYFHTHDLAVGLARGGGLLQTLLSKSAAGNPAAARYGGFVGQVDDVIVWPFAATPRELLEVMHARSEPALLAMAAAANATFVQTFNDAAVGNAALSRTPSVGPAGHALALNGTTRAVLSDFLDLGSSRERLSVAAWFRVERPEALRAEATLFAATESSTTYLALRWTTSSGLEFAARNNASETVVAASGEDYADRAWHYV
eukprot:7638952-Pyramimonas_sp.AAC.1